MPAPASDAHRHRPGPLKLLLAAVLLVSPMLVLLERRMYEERSSPAVAVDAPATALEREAGPAAPGAAAAARGAPAAARGAAPSPGGGPRTQVFLHSHGRSGSTIAEALLFSTTNVFYLDEPLKYLKVERLARSGAHSLTRSLARSLARPLARSPARSRTHALARSRWRRARRAWTA